MLNNKKKEEDEEILMDESEDDSDILNSLDDNIDDDLDWDINSEGPSLESILSNNKKVINNNNTLDKAIKKEGFSINREGRPINADHLKNETSSLNHDPKKEYQLKDLELFVASTLRNALEYKYPISKEMAFARAYREGEDKLGLLEALPDGQIATKHNFIDQFAQIKKASITSSKTILQAKPLNKEALETIEATTTDMNGDEVDNSAQGSYGDLPKYLVADQIVKDVLSKNHVKELMNTLVDDAITVGVGIVAVSYNERLSTGTNLNNHKGEVQFSILDPSFVIPSPTAYLPNLQDLDYVYLYNPVTITELKQHENCAKWEAEIIDVLTTQGGHTEKDNTGLKDSMDSVSQLGLDKYTKTIDLVTLYRRVWIEDLKRYVILASDFIAYDGKCAFILKENVPLNIDRIPLAVYKSFSNSNKFFPTSPVQKVMGLQSIYNFIHSLLANTLLSSVNPILVASENSGLSAIELAALQVQHAGAAAIISSDAISNDLQYVHKNLNTQNVSSYVSMLENTMKQLLGVSDLDEGNTGSVQTAGALNIKSFNSAKSDKELLDNWGLFQSDLATLVWKTIVANYSERTISYSDKNPRSESSFVFLEYAPDLMEGLDIEFKLEAEVLTTTEYQQKLAAMKELYIQQGQLGFDQDLISPDEYVNFADLPNKDAALARMSLRRETISNLRTQVRMGHIHNYSLIWDLVNRVYALISQETGQLLPPFTPLNSIPPQLSSQVVLFVQQMVSNDPIIQSIVPMQYVPFYLDEEIFSSYMEHLDKITTVSKLQQELEGLQPKPVNMDTEQGGTEGKNKNEQRSDAKQAKASGASAQQPNSQMVEQGM